jgi:dipeptidyl aminopeptidase/acylaminoacyl peptidase
MRSVKESMTNEKKQRRPIERDDLYTLKIVGDAQISPDGTKVAYVVKVMDREKNDYVSNIHIWENGETRQYTSGGKDSCPRWSPDGRWLAFLSGREEKQQIYIMPTSGGEAIRCTEQKLGAGEPVWSPDSTHIAFAGPVPFGKSAGDAEEDKDKEKPAPTKIIDRAIFKLDGVGFIHDRRNHIFVLDITSKTVRQLTDGDFNERDPTWSPDGKHLAFSANRNPDWDTRRGSDIWIVPADGGEPRRITGNDGWWSQPVFSPDGRQIAYIGCTIPESGDFDFYLQLWTIDRNGRHATNLLADVEMQVGHLVNSDWNVGVEPTLFWKRDGIYFLVTERGTANVYRWNDGEIQPVTVGRHDVMTFSVTDDGTIAYAVSDVTHPAEIFLCRSGKATQITQENRALLDQLDLQTAELVTLPGADGEEIEGWIMKPLAFQEGQSYPLLLYIHGGPATAYGETFFHELQWWVAQGFGLAFCNPHGSASYGKHFQTVIRHDWGNRDYFDIMTFTDYVAALPWVDEHRLAAAGGSYGGFMVNWIAGHTDRFAALCTQRSICNMVSQGGTSDFAPFRKDTAGGTPECNPDLLWKQSPLKYAANVHTPMLILHQEQDHRCPIEQAEQWFEALKRLGVPTRFIRFPEESHGLSRSGKPSRRYERLGYMLEWFKEYV